MSLLSTDSRLFYQKLQEKRIWDIVDDDNRISYPLPSLPGYYQKKLLGKRLGYNKPEIAHRYLWENTAVKRILQNEFYIGTLVCHQVYTEMLTACETDIAELTKEIEEFRHMDETVKQRKKDMKKSIDLLDDILQDGHISDTHLRMLVEKVRIFQIDGKLRGVIALNGTFRAHLDFYDENGEIIRWESELWHEQVSEGDWGPMRNEDV